MYDIRAIRENPAAFDAALSRRGVEAMSASILGIDKSRRACIQAAEEAQAEQNKASKLVGAAKAKGDVIAINITAAGIIHNRRGWHVLINGCGASAGDDGLLIDVCDCDLDVLRVSQTYINACAVNLHTIGNRYGKVV